MSDNLVIVNQPEEETVSLTEVKTHLRIDGTDEETYLTGLITAARDWCEMVSRRTFVTTIFKTTYDRWPGVKGFALPRPPLLSVDHIKYYKSDGTLVTVDSSVYQVETSCTPGRVILAYNQQWSADELRPGFPIEIQFQAGYGDAVDVPAKYKHAIKLLIGHWYENREAVTTSTVTRQLELALNALLMSDRGDW